MEPENTPLDFQYLELEFLPYFLTSERVQVSWKPEIEDRFIVKPEFNKFYISLRLLQAGLQDHMHPPYDVHTVVFNRIRNYNHSYGYNMDADLVDEIIPLGMRHPWFREMPVVEVVDKKLGHFKTLHILHSRWVNHELFIEAVRDMIDKEF